jgi:hypothetical protein
MSVRFSLAFLAALALAVPVRAATDEYANIHTVAVVSLLGGVQVNSANDFKWTNTPDYPLPADLQLDDFATAQAAAALKDRFTVIRLPSQRYPAANYQASFLSGPFDKLRDRLKSDPATANVDAYIVISPNTVDVLGSEWTGLSLTHAKGMFGRESTFLWAVYDVTVYDARTGSRIDYGTAKMTRGYALAAVETCDNGLWASAPEQITDAQKQQIADQFQATIAQSLSVALMGAQLIPDTGDPADLTVWDGRPLACHKD